LFLRRDPHGPPRELRHPRSPISCSDVLGFCETIVRAKAYALASEKPIPDFAIWLKKLDQRKLGEIQVRAEELAERLLDSTAPFEGCQITVQVPNNFDQEVQPQAFFEKVMPGIEVRTKPRDDISSLRIFELNAG
jgi:hypothetical protein